MQKQVHVHSQVLQTIERYNLKSTMDLNANGTAIGPTILSVIRSLIIIILTVHQELIIRVREFFGFFPRSAASIEELPSMKFAQTKLSSQLFKNSFLYSLEANILPSSFIKKRTKGCTIPTDILRNH